MNELPSLATTALQSLRAFQQQLVTMANPTHLVYQAVSSQPHIPLSHPLSTRKGWGTK